MYSSFVQEQKQPQQPPLSMNPQYTYPYPGQQPYPAYPYMVTSPSQPTTLPQAPRCNIFAAFNKKYLTYFMRWSEIYPDLTVLSDTCTRFFQTVKEDDPVIYNSFMSYLAFKDESKQETKESRETTSSNGTFPWH